MRLSYRQLPTWIYCDKVTRCLPAWLDRLATSGRRAASRPLHGWSKFKRGTPNHVLDLPLRVREVRSQQPLGVRSELWYCKILVTIFFARRQSAHRSASS